MNYEEREAHFKRRVRVEGEGQYTPLTTYVNAKTKILMRHEACGHEYMVAPEGFLAGTRCPSCRNNRRGAKVKTTETFKKELYELVGEEYKLEGEYSGVHEPIKLLHTKCNEVWTTTPHSIKTKRSRCPKCGAKKVGDMQRKTHEQFLEDVSDEFKSLNTILGEYKSAKHTIPVECNICGMIRHLYPRNIYVEVGCRGCKMSAGERSIQAYLDITGEKYITQKSFKGLVGNNNYPLKYDFYLPELRALIEYNGIQHYESHEYFGGEERYKSQIANDIRKKQFAESEGYYFLVIPYTIKASNQINKELDKFIQFVKRENTNQK